MRFTVLAFDTLVYVPALLMFAKVWQGTRSARRQVKRHPQFQFILLNTFLYA